MSPIYEPLHFPPKGASLPDRVQPENASMLGRLKDFCTLLHLSSRARYLVDQMKARDAIPPEVWGTDLARQKLAAAISAIVQNGVQWPNAYFIPEDPFKLVLFNVYCDGSMVDDFEIEETICRIEELVGWNSSQELWDELFEMTFGEVVDTLLEMIPDCRIITDMEVTEGASGDVTFKCSVSGKEAVIDRAVARDPRLASAERSPAPSAKVSERAHKTTELIQPLPLDGPAALEGRPCPSLAAFLEIRSYLSASTLGVPRASIRPSVAINGVLDKKGVRRLDGYLQQRFRVCAPPRPNPLWRDVVAVGLAATLICALAVLAMLAMRFPARSSYGNEAFYAFPLFVVVLGLIWTLGVGACAFLPSRIWHRLRHGKRPRMVTFADLVTWIQSERAKLRSCPQPSE